VRFRADSDYANLNCNRDPQNTNARLGIAQNLQDIIFNENI